MRLGGGAQRRSRGTARAVRFRTARAVVVGALILAWPEAVAHAQRASPDKASSPGERTGPSSLAALVDSPEERQRELARAEARFAEARRQASALAPPSAEDASSLGATLDELRERQRLLEQSAVAFDAHARSLRRIADTRQLDAQYTAEEKAWRGFSVPPPYPVAMVEQLRDAAAAERREARSYQTMLSLFEQAVARDAASLEESRKQLRLARDQAELAGPTERRTQWLLRLAELRVQSKEAALQAAELDRLAAGEGLRARRTHAEFLERKLETARAQTRFAPADLDAVLAQVGEQRRAVERELADAVAADATLRAQVATERESLGRARDEAAGQPTQGERVRQIETRVDALQSRAQAGEVKIEVLRSMATLLDLVRATWQDRFWATGEHGLADLREREQRNRAELEDLRQWRGFAEAQLSAAVSQALSEAVKAQASGVSALDRERALRRQEALEARAALYQRLLSALVLASDFKSRLGEELERREAELSAAGRVRFALEALGAYARRLSDTELYVAEVDVVAEGRKVSIPRIVTVGKVAIGLAIFALGLLLARLVYGLTRRWAVSRVAVEHRAALLANAVATAVALVALTVAMATVRIPWTVFAFIGGALALGVGFGAQALVANFIAGIMLLLGRSVRVGDIIELNQNVGRVVAIGLKSTLIRRSDGIEALVPNRDLVEKSVVNWTLTDTAVRQRVTVGVAYDSPIATVTALMRQAALEHPLVEAEPAPSVLFDEFGRSSLVFTLNFWLCLGPTVDGAVVRSDLRQRIAALFGESGIAIASP